MYIGGTMKKKDKALMEKYDITSTSKTVFFYKEFKYDNLDRAVSYAEHEAKKLLPVTADASSQ
jgi:hypothetical protein